jgi:hypothetical protein
VGDEADATGIVLELRVVETTRQAAALGRVHSIGVHLEVVRSEAGVVRALVHSSVCRACAALGVY